MHNCLICGSQLSDPRAKTCSSACRQKAYRQRNSKEATAPAPVSDGPFSWPSQLAEKLSVMRPGKRARLSDAILDGGPEGFASWGCDGWTEEDVHAIRLTAYEARVVYGPTADISWLGHRPGDALREFIQERP